MAQSTWDEIFSAADARVARECSGFTTLIGLAVAPSFVVGGAVGDSKVYFLEEGGDFNDLSERQRKNPPIGGGCSWTTLFHLAEAKGSLLVVSDGVWKYAGYENLKDAAKEIPNAGVEGLRDCVLSRQGGSLPDDFSILGMKI